MTGTQLTISCPRCNFTQNLPAETIVDGPVSQTCPSCGLLFRIGHSLSDAFPSDPAFETDGGWYVRKDSEEVLYFPSIEILRRWSQEGHVTSSDEISKKGKSWRPIYELPEFASMMTWKSEDIAEPRTPTSELEQVSEEMIEVEEYPVEHGSKKNTWIGFAAVALLVLAAAGTFVLSKPAPENTEPEPELEAKVEPVPVPVKAAAPVPEKDAASSPEEPAISPSKDVTESAATAPDTVQLPPKKTVTKKARTGENRKRKSANKKEPARDYDSLMSLGAKQLRNKKTAPLAVQTFMSAMRFPEATSEARAKLGRAFLMVGDMKSAIKNLEKARKMNPGYRPALWDLARAYQRIQNRDQAISVFRSLSNLLDPDSRQGQQVARELERMGVTP